MSPKTHQVPVTVHPSESARQSADTTAAMRIASQLKIPFVHLAEMQIPHDALDCIPAQWARKLVCIPLRKEVPVSAGLHRLPILHVAMASPNDLAALQQLEFVTGCNIKPSIAVVSDLMDAIDRYYSPDRWLEGLIGNIIEGTELDIVAEEEIQTTTEETSSEHSPVVKLVNLILQRGIEAGASDIHLEPTGHGLLVRYRVGGMLKEFTTLPKWLQEPLCSRIKILAKLDISDRRRPQDGRIKVKLPGRETDIRVSTLPTQYGEKIVLRILASASQIKGVETLGMSPQALAMFKEAASQPQGMILVTGPTGSGKTTTLYSFLTSKLNPTINIVTVEDPIEIQLAGVNQVQVNVKAGMTFANCLRSILRQDPDVIMVGEIRDRETHEIAFHAALTGHLVLSTLHTNGTIATVTRLLDMGVDPFVLSDSINLIVAQRLLRRICDNCKEQYHPTASSLHQLGLDPNAIYWHGRGCDTCEGTGYSSRMGIYELLRLTPELAELICKHATEHDLRRGAVKGGMRFLLDEALGKIREGTTTPEEVLRVVQVDARELPPATMITTQEKGPPMSPDAAANTAFTGSGVAGAGVAETSFSGLSSELTVPGTQAAEQASVRHPRILVV
ncbi:MAG TPA: GspE/PulE family protein, partial [Terriglobales bacterium]|nr:GspE/PulE family protein [Terriglobales bacterium]